MGSSSRLWYRTSIFAFASALLLGLQAPRAAAVTPLERDLKKITRYLNDGFCEDALRLATDLSKSKEGATHFDVWFNIIQAQYCLQDITSALTTVDSIRQSVTMDATQESILNAFVKEKIEAFFGELRLSLPGDKTGTVELAIERVGELAEKQLEPYFQAVKKKLTSGVSLPARVYLPHGTYEIDQVERTIENFRGINYVVGKERLSRWKRTQFGDGQAVGFGYMFLQGFSADPLIIEPLDGGNPQQIVNEYRPSFVSSPFLELSSTHSTRLGTMGIVGLRGNLRARPPVAVLGGVQTDGSTTLTPAYYSGGPSLHLAFPGPAGITFQGGLGIRFSYLSYVRYLAFVTVTDSAGIPQTIKTGIDLPALGLGPELTITAGRAFKVGPGGIQVGLELQAGVIVLAPMGSSGSIAATDVDLDGDGSDDTMHYELSQETLWGENLSALIFIRTPFF